MSRWQIPTFGALEPYCQRLPVQQRRWSALMPQAQRFVVCSAANCPCPFECSPCAVNAQIAPRYSVCMSGVADITRSGKVCDDNGWSHHAERLEPSALGGGEAFEDGEVALDVGRHGYSDAVVFDGEPRCGEG
jgi:hypothetical protein